MNQKNSISYAARVCNIDTTEIQRRKYAGYAGLFATILLAIISLTNDWSFISTFTTLFFPSFLAALGFLQAHYAFCANYGLRGQYRSANNNKIQTAPSSDKSANRRRAIKIIGKSLMLAIASSLSLAIINSAF